MKWRTRKSHTTRGLIATVATHALTGMLLLGPIVYAVAMHVLLFGFVLEGRSYPPWTPDVFLVVAVVAGYAVVPALVGGWRRRAGERIEAWGKRGHR